MQRYLLLVLVFFFGTVTAAPVIIDFESKPHVGSIGLSGYTEYGFTISPNSETYTQTNSSTATHAFLGGIGNDSTSLLWGTPGISKVTLTDNAGVGFSLDQFDAAYLGGISAAADFTVVGNKLGGGQVIEIVSLTNDITTVALTENFAGLLSAEFYYDSDIFNAPFEIDNIQLQYVPVPAAVWLFGSALVGLGWVRRKPSL